MYGNRGCLHDEARQIRRRFAVKRWIACRLEFRGRRRSPLMQPGRYTELFFLDEATALAAGHRPCAECRREDYTAFVARWRVLHATGTTADAVDERLHEERVEPTTRAHRLHNASLHTLPDGAFVLHDGAPHLVLGSRLLRWTAEGYTSRVARPRGGRATLITPPSLVALLDGRESALRLVHPSAHDG